MGRVVVREPEGQDLFKLGMVLKHGLANQADALFFLDLEGSVVFVNKPLARRYVNLLGGEELVQGL